MCVCVYVLGVRLCALARGRKEYSNFINRRTIREINVFWQEKSRIRGKWSGEREGGGGAPRSECETAVLTLMAEVGRIKL